jgi:hypothetical protein
MQFLRLISLMQNAPPIIYPASLLGYWKGQNNPNDSTTNARNGSAGAQTAYMTGQSGNAFSFNGNAASKVTLPSINAGAAWSLEFYLYRGHTIVGASEHLISNLWTSASNFGASYVDANNRISYYSNSIQRILSRRTIALTTWTKILLTYDGSRVRLWIDDVPDMTELATHSESFNTAFCFGQAQVTESNALNGGLDEIKLYNVVQEGIRGLIAWYAGENNGNDSTGNGFGLTLGASPSYATGQSGNGFNFTGATNQVPTMAPMSLDPSYSIDFYVKPAVNPGGSFYHTVSNTYTASGNYGALYYAGTNRLEYWTGGTLKVASTNNSVPSGSFTRVTIQYDASISKTKLYIGGVLNATESGTHSELFSCSPAIGYGGESSVFNGVIDEVKMYNKLLI